jgi:hypothetical protein
MPQITPTVLKNAGDYDPARKTAVVFARVRLVELERSHIWRAGIQNKPPGVQLVKELRGPAMNFKEFRGKLTSLLGPELMKRLHFQSFQGSKTLFLDGKYEDVLREKLLEDAPEPVETEGE